ncbi:MAG: hypothetical protein FJW30_18930 [Acidobacteria bacterium]|nr:hypothetical protein [Acidobacteriota bacterium]
MMSFYMKTDWQALAKAKGLDGNERVTAPLEALEAQFRTLTPKIELMTEPVNFYVLPLDGDRK